jgi:beta-galactosidase
MQKINWIKYATCFFLLLYFTTSAAHAQSTNSFAYNDSAFLLNGKPFQMISGEIHYPRVPKEAWRHRMKMAKAMGINTIGTYVFWNVHEPQKGKYNFSGNNDIAAFVKIAQEEGLWVVLRPSPYVCAEWEFGGYPYWLQNEKGLQVRSRETKYIQAYRQYIMQIGKQLAPLQIHKGGNIILVQVENEYGSYSNDKEYLELNRKMFVEAGFDGTLYTCDPAKDVDKGHLPGLFPAVNGLDKPSQMKSLVRKYNNNKGPFFIAEWYPAWFDWWGEKHHTVPAENYSGKLDTVLAAGISINMYMFHGGTTRGFMNGANYYDSSGYEPQISSYDYDAPLDEAGNATAKFWQFRNAISKNLPAGTVLPDVPLAKETISIPAITLTKQVSIFNLLAKPKSSNKPLTFEALNQAYGYMLYRTTLNGGTTGTLKINELRDYGIVFINGKRVGILDRRMRQDSLFVTLPKGKVVLDILVENMGRINYGPHLLKNEKGITKSVVFNGREINGWQMFSLPFEQVANIPFQTVSKTHEAPEVKQGYFSIDKPGDAYFDMSKWGKGCVWINGHHLGRYWNIGPQQTIYVPAEWLKKGKNEVIVLELIRTEQNQLETVTKPELNKLNK